MTISAIIPAGGRGTRMKADRNKIFLNLGGMEIIARTLAVLDAVSAIDEIVIVAAECDKSEIEAIINRINMKTPVLLTKGGDTRQRSVYNGLHAAHSDIALIHDGARCLITPHEIEMVIEDAKKYGAAALGAPVKDTLKTIDSNSDIIATVDRTKTVHIFTPQVFNRDEITRLHEQAAKDGISATDDCSIFEHYGKTVHLTLCSEDNIKITTPTDIAIGEEILKRRSSK